MKIVLVSGMSGAGKSTALHVLEDCNFYCMDNLPTAFLNQILSSDDQNKSRAIADKIAIGVGSADLHDAVDELYQTIQALKRKGLDVSILFLDADDNILLRRYNETRRLHPVSRIYQALPVRECIEKERALLERFADSADALIDTSHLTPTQLSKHIIQILGEELGSIKLTIQSFGYKKGLPRNSDYVFDVRSLPNPYWDSKLRSHRGDQQAVIEFIEKDPHSHELVNGIYGLLESLLVHFSPESRKYITVSIGCTGGFHRSVYVVDRIHELLCKSESFAQWDIHKQHRDS